MSIGAAPTSIVRRCTRSRGLKALMVVAPVSVVQSVRPSGARAPTGQFVCGNFGDIPSLILPLIPEVGAGLVEVREAWSRSEQVGPAEARRRLALYVDFYARNGRLIRAVVDAAHRDDAVGQ